MHDADDLVSAGARSFHATKERYDVGDSGMTQSNYNYTISPIFPANSNPAFVEDDEGVEEERPSIYRVLEGKSRGHEVTSGSSAQLQGLTNEMDTTYVKADYEELPHPPGIRDEISGYFHIDDGSVVVGAGPFYRSGGAAIPDGKQHLVSPKKGVDGKARRRSNPLYDFPVTRFPVGVHPLQVNQGHCGGSRFYCAFQALVLLVATAALVLAIVNIVSGVGGGQTSSIDRKDLEELVLRYLNGESDCSLLCQLAQNDLNNRNSSDLNSAIQRLLLNNSELQNIIFDLQSKVQSLETAISWQSAVNRNLSSQIDSQKKQIVRLDTETMNITSTFDLLKKDLSYQISQVPRGLVNLTSCSHRFESSGTSIRLNVTTTNSLNLNDSVVLSVVCSTEGGTLAWLRSDRNSPSVYSCECSGQTNSSVVSRFCIMHYWTCPILP